MMLYDPLRSLALRRHRPVTRVPFAATRCDDVSRWVRGRGTATSDPRGCQLLGPHGGRVSETRWNRSGHQSLGNRDLGDQTMDLEGSGRIWKDLVTSKKIRCQAFR